MHGKCFKMSHPDFVGNKEGEGVDLNVAVEGTDLNKMLKPWQTCKCPAGWTGQTCNEREFVDNSLSCIMLYVVLSR